jgi:hypothetical protein
VLRRTAAATHAKTVNCRRLEEEREDMIDCMIV